MLRNILLIEDDEQVLRAVARVLRLEGYATWSVASFGAAQALTRDFDTGIFDLDLGDGDGLVLARDLLERGRVSRVVFFTSCTDPVRIAEAEALGPVVTKGEPPGRLLDVLGDYDSGHSSSGVRVKLTDSGEARRVGGKTPR